MVVEAAEALARKVEARFQRVSDGVSEPGGTGLLGKATEGVEPLFPSVQLRSSASIASARAIVAAASGVLKSKTGLAGGMAVSDEPLFSDE